MNILIVGLGSIGQRHLRILKKIYRNKITIYTLTNSKTNRVIKDNFESFKVKSLSKYYGIKKLRLMKLISLKSHLLTFVTLIIILKLQLN